MLNEIRAFVLGHSINVLILFLYNVLRIPVV